MAAEKNMKNIKLWLYESIEEENNDKNTEESNINWCELIDLFDNEDQLLMN